MKLISTLLFLTVAFQTSAQIWAVTEKGDTIYVFSNGTWSFDEDEQLNEDKSLLDYLNTKISLDTISGTFEANSTSKKRITSQYDFFDFVYDGKKWKRVPPAQLNEDAEFAFQSKDKDIYMAIIAEEIELGMENIYKIALNNIKENLGIDPKIMKSEVRNINGFDVIRGVINLNLNGLDFIFDSYYYSDERGTVQLTTWTASNLHEKYEKEILNMLNGFLVKKVEVKEGN